MGEIQAEVEIPGPTLSHHLDLLRRAGLVESRKEERYIYYSVKPGRGDDARASAHRVLLEEDPMSAKVHLHCTCRTWPRAGSSTRSSSGPRRSR